MRRLGGLSVVFGESGAPLLLIQPPYPLQNCDVLGPTGVKENFAKIRSFSLTSCRHQSFTEEWMLSIAVLTIYNYWPIAGLFIITGIDPGGGGGERGDRLQ